MAELSSELATALANLEEDRTCSLVQRRLEAGDSALLIAAACREALIEVGRRYEVQEYVLSDLIVAGEICREVMSVIEPMLGSAVDSEEPGTGTVVIGTVQNDIHDIGRNIMISMLKAVGMRVFDLGSDVAPATFVAKVQEVSADILAMSGLLTYSIDSMKETIDALARAGIRDTVKVIIGGGPVDRRVRDYVGADAFSRDALEGIQLCRELLERRMK